MAYLGKISAVLAANTQDFTRGLREAGQELQRFQKQASGLRLNLDSNALDKTLTNLQRFQKTIQEIKQQIAANPEQRGLFPDPNRLQQQFKAFENIGKPLTELKNKIEGLSQTMQAGLYPELGKIQAGFQNLYRGIQRGSTTYDKETARIEGLIGALNRLQKTAAAAADFGDLTKKLTASNTGASFYQPRAKESLQDSLSLRTRAEAVPARFRGGIFADIAAAAEENAQKIEAQAARILQIQNRIGSAGPVTPMNLLQARGQAQENLDRLTSRQEFFNSAYRKELRSAEIQQVVSPGSDRVVDSLTQRFASLSASLRGISGTQFEPLVGSVGKVVEQLNRGAISADKAKAAIEKLAAASRGTQLVGRMEDQAIASLRTKQSLDRETIRRQGQIERSSAPYQGEMGPLTKRQQKERDTYLASSQVRQDAGLAREEFNRTMLPRFAELQKSAEGTGDTRAIKQSQDMIRLANQMDSALRKAFSSQDPVIAAQHLAKYQAQLAGILPALDRAEKKTKTLSDAQKQYGMFVGASGGRGDKLDPVLEGAASDIMTARQFRGQFAEGNLKGRVAVSQGILQAEEQILRLTKIRQQIEDRPGLSNDDRARRYERNRKQIEAVTQALLRMTAAESGGVFREDRVLAAAQRARKNTGSFGVAGAASAQLAFQQGLFAIDDLISSTGGLEYKLRAVGNNITQLGLLLGQSGVIPGLTATTGLFVGLAAVLGGQAVSAILRWASGTDEAEKRARLMNDALSRQKSLAEDLAGAFRDLGDSLSRGTFSEAAASAKQFGESLAKVRATQKESRDQALGDFSPAIQQERASQAKLQEELEASADPVQRVALQKKILESQARERAAVSSARVAPVGLDELMPKLSASGQNRVRDAQDQAARGFSVNLNTSMRGAVSEDIRFLKKMGGQDARVQELETFLLRLEDPVRRAVDELALSIVEAARGPAAQIAAAQQEVAEAIKLGVPGARLFELQLNKNADKLSEAYKKLEDAAKEKDMGKQVKLVREAEANVRDVQEQQFRIAQQADAIRYERIVEPQRQTQERMGRARGNLGEAGLGEGRLARRMREIEADRAIIEDRAKMPAFQTPEMIRGLQDAETALNEEAAAIEAATVAIKAFADALNRASEETKANLNSAQQAADEARRADLGGGTPRTQEARRQADADLARQREIARQAQAEIAVERDRLEQMQRPDAERLQRIDEQLKSGVDGGDRESLIRERAAIQGKMEDDALESQARIDAARDASTQEEEQRKAGVRGREMSRDPEERFKTETEQGLADIQAYFERRAEANNGLRPDGDAKAQADAEARFRKDRENEARTATAAGRGRELGMTERDRFRRDMEEGPIADLAAAAKEIQARGENPAEFLRQGIKNLNVAPMLQQLEEERQNALMQGPSRAALSVSDVSTSQGQSELTRLLRGDDAAKDVNLAELQKQTQKFDDLIAAVKAANPGVLL